MTTTVSAGAAGMLGEDEEMSDTLLAWSCGFEESEAGHDLVYAATAERAVAIAREKGDVCAQYADYEDMSIVVKRHEEGDRFAAAEGVERKTETLRLAGWRMDDESACGSCGLHPMDDERFAICEDCSNCKECGCDSGQDDPCPTVAERRDGATP